jgi:hypothetical protein
VKISLSRTPRPDPRRIYESVSGFVADVVGAPSWSPRIGTKVQGDWPGLVDLFAKGGAHLFIDSTADDVAKSQAYSRETFGTEATPTPDLSIRTPGPSTHVMLSTKSISVGDSIVPAGSLADAGDPLVKRFPDSWQPAPEGYTS